MNFLHRDLGTIVEDDLRSLIENRVPETKHIEYKAAFNDLSEADKKVELLADLTSFANTDGGVLFVGISTKDGLPLDLKGLPVSEFDGARNRVEQILDNGVEPRIYHEIKEIPIGSDGKAVMAIRVRRSWNQPHRVVAEKSNRFCARNSGGKYDMDVEHCVWTIRNGGAANSRRAHAIDGSPAGWCSERSRAEAACAVRVRHSVLGNGPREPSG